MPDLSRLAKKMAQECPGFRLRQASRVVSRIYDDALRPVGLQQSQLPVLTALAIYGEPGATMNALAQTLVMDRTTLTRSVRPLEKAGLVRVARSADDARAKVVLLTRAGEQTLEAAFPLWEAAMKRVRAAVGAASIADLHRRLDEVIALAFDSQGARRT
jgi:DNA-binding MarR family transcriptional regulator